MRRLTRGRAATDDEGTPQASAASEPVSATSDAQQGGVGVPSNGSVADEPKTTVLAGGAGSPVPAGGDVPGAPIGDGTKSDGTKGDGTKTDATAVVPAVERGAGRDLPAGVDPAELEARPTSAKRSRLRRRLRYLRAVREVLLRDVGGFYYEAQRSEQGPDGHRRLLEAKTARLARLDDEMRDLEARLEEPRPQTVLRQPGLGGTCPQCGELHSSDARFCSRCGTALTGRGARAAKPTTHTGKTAAPVTTAGEEAKATTASLWGRPKRPDPAVSDAPTQAAAGERREAEAAAGEPREAEAAAGEPREAEAAAGESRAEAPAAVAKAEEERA